MEILNAILALLMTAAIVAIFWAIPIILGVKWAKRNKVSPHWMWFGIHPVGGWIAFAVIRWGGRIDKVGNVAVKWITGKVACPSCGKFNPMNNAFCAQCGIPILKPVCPRCKADKTRFVGRVGHYIGWGVLLMFIGFCPLSILEQSGVGGAMTWGDLAYVLFAVPFLVAATISFVRPFSRRTKRIKCSACGTETPVTAVATFQKPPAPVESPTTNQMLGESVRLSGTGAKETALEKRWTDEEIAEVPEDVRSAFERIEKGEYDQPGVFLVAQMKEAKNPFIRAQAIILLAKERPTNLLNVASEGLSDEDSRVREVAAQALATSTHIRAFSGLPIFKTLLLAARDDEDERVRYWVEKCLSKM